MKINQSTHIYLHTYIMRKYDQPPTHATQRSISAAFSADFQGVGRSSSAWAAKVMELAERGVTIRELLTFYRASAVSFPRGTAVRKKLRNSLRFRGGLGRLGEVG